MRAVAFRAGLVVVCTGLASLAGRAAEPITLDNVEPPPSISAEEPLAERFSLEQAARYLDSAALDWQKTHACTACHTMFPYLMARPVLNSVSLPTSEVRQFFEEVVAGRREAMPSYACHDLDAVQAAVAVGTAAAMAINDRWTTGKLHPATRQALDRMWKLQRADGGWDWPFRDTPPLKVREHYGVTLAAVGVGMAPDDYGESETAARGLAGVRQYLRNTPTVSLHERAMTLWASAHVAELLDTGSARQNVEELLAAQRLDGGWSMASLVDNTRDPSLAATDRALAARAEPGYGTEFLVYVGRDATYRSALSSDGYATGFAIFVARQAGVAANDERLQKGLAWLKSHQRASGRWFTPSQAWHSAHLISNAGSAYAVLALQACGEVPSSATASSERE